jgi:hypothetical protein
MHIAALHIDSGRGGSSRAGLGRGVEELKKKHRLHGYYENTVKQIEKLLNILIHVHNMSYVCISMCIYKYISIQPIITCHHSQFSEYVYSPDHIGSAICEKMGRSMSI